MLMMYRFCPGAAKKDPPELEVTLAGHHHGETSSGTEGQQQ